MKKCHACGKELKDHIRYCINCGASQLAATQVPADPVATSAPAVPAIVDPVPAPAVVPAAVPAVPRASAPPQIRYIPPKQEPVLCSDWDGTAFDTLVHSLACGLMIFFSCGIATPWAICYLARFIIHHTFVDGKRLAFTGTGKDLFGKWLVWTVLSMITCGIYNIWSIPKLYQWICNSIHFAD